MPEISSATMSGLASIAAKEPSVAPPGAVTETDRPSFSLVIETENVAAQGLEGLERCLESLEQQTLSPREAVDVVVLQSGDVPTEMLTRLSKRYPWVSVSEVPEDTGYYRAKTLGVEQVKGTVVVFADSDCDYVEGWLERMVLPFRDPAVEVVAGVTGLITRDWFEVGVSAVQFTGPHLHEPRHRRLRASNYYHANNVAFRRELLSRHPIPRDRPFLRGECAEHIALLRDAGVDIWQQPLARSAHPSLKRTSFFWRFVLYGEEDVRKARAAGKPALFSVLRREGSRTLSAGWRLLTLIRDQPRHIARLPLALPVTVTALLLIYSSAALVLIAPEARPSRWFRR